MAHFNILTGKITNLFNSIFSFILPTQILIGVVEAFSREGTFSHSW